MPAPANPSEFIRLIEQSGLVERDRLSSFKKKQADSGKPPPADVTMTADVFVNAGLLTRFQAEQLLQGKWRGFTIGKYKVLERIGLGGMGQVFLCEHSKMKRRVAVKVLPAAHAKDPSNLERFFREARAAAALDHPNIVRAFDLDEDNQLNFLVMEYIEGPSLYDIVQKGGPFDINRAVHYIQQAAQGLQHAHEAGLVHRDIKPSNIVVDKQGVVKLLDLGLARFYHDTVDQLTKEHDEHNVLGTADFVAPEQTLDSHEVDIRADVYALGCTFYFVLAGHAPFPEGTVSQKLLWHQSRLPRPIQQLRPDLPAGLSAVIEKMLAKQPAHRQQTPAEVVRDLTPWLIGSSPPPSDSELPDLSPAAVKAGSPLLGQPTPMPTPKKWIADGPVMPGPAGELKLDPRLPVLAPSTPPPANDDRRQAVILIGVLAAGIAIGVAGGWLLNSWNAAANSAAKTE